MRPDYDVIVIGGGPAGIAAAVRVRWLKRHHAACCKVVIVDPASLGGLAAMGSTVLTGPSFQMTSNEILPKLLGDVGALQIPHVEEAASSIEVDEDGWVHVELSSGRRLTSSAAVIACGMRQLGREAYYWGRGVTGLSMGVDHVVATLERIATSSEYRRVLFVGSSGLRRLRPILEAARLDAREFLYLEEPIAAASPAPASENTLQGWVKAIDGEPRLERVVILSLDGSEFVIDSVDLLVMDFLSLESRPTRSFRAEHLSLDDQGFIMVDRRGRTSLPGVFAAGDATGMPACVAKALGEGVVAGFEAYRHVYLRKFQSEPQLFAYFPWNGSLEDFHGELPDFDRHDLQLELLADPEKVARYLEKEHTPPALVREILASEPRAPSVLARACQLPLSSVESVVRSLLIGKLATLR